MDNPGIPGDNYCKLQVPSLGTQSSTKIAALAPQNSNEQSEKLRLWQLTFGSPACWDHV